MPFVRVPPGDQGATFVSLNEMMAASQVTKRLELLAGKPIPDDFDFEQIGFVLATRAQVEMRGFMEEHNVGVAISCTGVHSKPFRYPQAKGVAASQGQGTLDKLNVPVSFAGGRMAALRLALPYCVTAFMQKKCVLVHCNQSFHRGPLGFAMIARMLFGCEPSEMMMVLGRMREIYYVYEEGKEFQGDSLWETLQWAKRLELLQPPKVSPKGSSAWGKPSQGAASSSGQGAASSSWQGVAASQGQGVAASQGKGVAASQEYLYRSMTVDHRELAEVNLAAKDPFFAPTKKGLDLAILVLDAVETGSKNPSPFVHFSLDFWEARKWKSMGEHHRGEKNTVVCRVSKTALKSLAASQGGDHPLDLDSGLAVGELLDMSTQPATLKWLNKYAHHSAVQARLPALSRAHACREVAVAWRGHLPEELFEVLDDNGLPLHFLGRGRFLQRACSKRGQLLGSENGRCVSF